MHMGRVQSPLSAQSFSAVIKGSTGFGAAATAGSGATGAGAGVAATLDCTTSGIFTFGADATFRLVPVCVLAFVADLGTGKADVGGDLAGLITGDGMGVGAGAVWVTDPLTTGVDAAEGVSRTGLSTGATTVGTAATDLPEVLRQLQVTANPSATTKKTINQAMLDRRFSAAEATKGCAKAAASADKSIRSFSACRTPAARSRIFFCSTLSLTGCGSGRSGGSSGSHGSMTVDGSSLSSKSLSFSGAGLMSWVGR